MVTYGCYCWLLLPSSFKLGCTVHARLTKVTPAAVGPSQQLQLWLWLGHAAWVTADVAHVATTAYKLVRYWCNIWFSLM
jgi:hypothetical protein